MLDAVLSLAAGNYDPDMGAGVYKLRIARSGEGRPGGYRGILCFQAGSRFFFVYGFAKADKANSTSGEKKELKKLAKILFAIPADKLAAMLQHGDLDAIIPKE